MLSEIPWAGYASGVRAMRPEGVSVTQQQDESEERFSVLEVFGMKLEVSNPRLAELLTLDAGQALTTDVRELAGDRRVMAEAAPEAILTGPTPKSEHDERVRHEFRAHVDSLGTRLGFEVDSDGTWSSMTGVDIVTRTVERPLTLAAAVHFVTEVASAASASDAHAVLFVVEGQQNADVFKVAIRQRRLHDLMRTTSLASLAEVAELVEGGVLDHKRAVLLLAPVANIDVGEMLAVLHAGGGESV